MLLLSTKSGAKQFSTFCVILLTNRDTGENTTFLAVFLRLSIAKEIVFGKNVIKEWRAGTQYMRVFDTLRSG